MACADVGLLFVLHDIVKTFTGICPGLNARDKDICPQCTTTLGTKVACTNLP